MGPRHILILIFKKGRTSLKAQLYLVKHDFKAHTKSDWEHNKYWQAPINCWGENLWVHPECSISETICGERFRAELCWPRM